MVQVDLITGFLGAGQTTFLRRYVRYLVAQGHNAVSYTHLYKIGNDSRTAIAYSQPLILPDGTIYGVVGVELLTSCLQTKLPYSCLLYTS